MDLLDNLRMSLINFHFVMIYIIHKILILLKLHLNYFTDSLITLFKYYL